MIGKIDARALALARRVAALSGWRRWLVAFAAGAMSALAFAPFYFLPLMAAGFSTLVLLIDGAAQTKRPRRAAFAAGWFFGFGYFLVGVYWMAFSFFVQAEEFAWMAPFAVTGLPAFLALFHAAAAALAVSFWRAGWRRIAFFAGVWLVFEYARGHILTGLPWNLPAQALVGAPALAQTAAWWGAYGLSLIGVFLAAAPVARVAEGRFSRGLATSLSGCTLLFLIGAVRFALPGPGEHDDVYVRIVQPNIPQREKIDSSLWGRNFQRNLDLSKGDTPGRLFVLWPENAAPLIAEVDRAMRELTTELPENAVLLAGAVRREDIEGTERYFNSIAVIVNSPRGRFAANYYDKHHLVPFGEYLPFQDFLRAVGLAQLAPYDEGFTAGEGPQTIKAAGPAFAALVCYEAIFPGEMHPKGERPEWLVTVTNDAWFGDTSGPRQHLDQARLRSIETGLPMARSANTGVSALIDTRGRVLERVRLYETGRIDAKLPRAAPPTLYTRLGDLIFLLLLMVVFFAGLQRTE